MEKFTVDSLLFLLIKSLTGHLVEFTLFRVQAGLELLTVLVSVFLSAGITDMRYHTRECFSKEAECHSDNRQIRKNGRRLVGVSELLLCTRVHVCLTNCGFCWTG